MSRTILQVLDVVQITVDYINYNVYYSFKFVQVGNIKCLHNNDNFVRFYVQKLTPHKVSHCKSTGLAMWHSTCHSASLVDNSLHVDITKYKTCTEKITTQKRMTSLARASWTTWEKIKYAEKNKPDKKEWLVLQQLAERQCKSGGQQYAYGYNNSNKIQPNKYTELVTRNNKGETRYSIYGSIDKHSHRKAV